MYGSTVTCNKHDENYICKWPVDTLVGLEIDGILEEWPYKIVANEDGYRSWERNKTGAPMCLNSDVCAIFNNKLPTLSQPSLERISDEIGKG